MSKFMKDICRAVGCENTPFCTRCGCITEKYWTEVLEGVSVVDEEGPLDDLDQVEMVMACEDTFNIEITDEEASDLKTPLRVKHYLTKKLRTIHHV